MSHYKMAPRLFDYYDRALIERDIHKDENELVWYRYKDGIDVRFLPECHYAYDYKKAEVKRQEEQTIYVLNTKLIKDILERIRVISKDVEMSKEIDGQLNEILQLEITNHYLTAQDSLLIQYHIDVFLYLIRHETNYNYLEIKKHFYKIKGMIDVAVSTYKQFMSCKQTVYEKKL